MKIALINPPYLVIYKKLNIHQEASIPLGLLYIAAVLEKAGYQVKVFDPNLHNLSLSELIGQIRLYEPELIGLTSVTPTFNAAQKISFELKRAFPGTPIVMGGPHVTSLPEDSLNFTPEVDFVIAGEGELTIIELVKALEEKKADFSAINGVGYRNNGKIILNPSRPVIEELDSLPYPAYHLLPIREYAPSVVYRIRGKSTFIMSSRGCPAFCTFCANTVTGRKLRVHSLDYFLGLLHHIIDVYGIRHFTIVDDNFIADPDRAREICKRIIKERLNITWFIFARTDHCQDLELLKIMRRAGCVYVQLGIESGNEEVLRQLGKNVSKEACVKAGMNCRQAGIDCMNSF